MEKNKDKVVVTSRININFIATALKYFETKNVYIKSMSDLVSKITEMNFLYIQQREKYKIFNSTVESVSFLKSKRMLTTAMESESLKKVIEREKKYIENYDESDFFENVLDEAIEKL